MQLHYSKFPVVFAIGYREAAATDFQVHGPVPARENRKSTPDLMEAFAKLIITDTRV